MSVFIHWFITCSLIKARDALNSWTLHIDHSLNSLINRTSFIRSIRSMLTYLIESRITIVEWWTDISVYLFQRLQMLVVNEILFFRSECIKQRWRSFNKHKWFTLLQILVTHLIMTHVISVAKLRLSYAFDYDLCHNAFLLNQRNIIFSSAH